MRIAVAGGRLQGLEVVYLAKKAGYHTLVIDKSKDVPAAGICDRFVRFEFTSKRFVPDDCQDVDLIIPAIEDNEVLLLVERWAQLKQIPLAFDSDAYALTCSKQKSDTLFDTMHLPAPRAWPGCGFPVMVKPDQASGSQGVCLYPDAAAFYAAFPGGRVPDTLVAQQYLAGPQFSIEVVGMPGQYVPLCVTDLHMDRVHDCKRVSAPSRLSSDRVRQLEKMALALAEAIDLKGIMDVEVILHEEDLKLLELDARFPSQTPMAVYWATGINMVQLLVEYFVFGHAACKKRVKNHADHLPYPGGTLAHSAAKDKLAHRQNPETISGELPDRKLSFGHPPVRWVVVEHIQAGPEGIRFLGEHIMGSAGHLQLKPGFFGCHEALTNYESGRTCWVATLIFCADNQKDLAAARNICYKQIHKNLRRSGKNAGNQPKAMQDQGLSAIKNSEQGNQDHDPAAAR
ncbi:MAG: 3-methylornithine--L-lysine ligase PylC [Desulfotignum sp.]|nr:3-methylornithine--L-lysine ligase PylC [Desulfotignum sp.]